MQNPQTHAHPGTSFLRSFVQVHGPGRRWVVLGVSAASFFLIVVVEMMTPANVVGAYGFVLPILLVATARNRRLMVLTLMLCVVATYIGLLRPTKPGRFVSALINRTVVAGVLIGVAYFAMTREERKAREEEARAELLRANAQLVEVKDALSRSERLAALGLLASSVAHEVGTPLHSVAWHVQAIAEEPNLTPEVRKTVGIIDSELARVVRIIREKLSLTRRPKTEPALLRLDQLVHAVVSLMEPTFVGKGVRLLSDLGREPVLVWGDAEQLKQVLVNLLTNALAATKDTDEVIIVLGRRAATLSELEEARRTGKPAVATMVTLTVRDTGCGMPEDHLAHALEPFFTTKAVGDGTGLGLYLSREIIMAHGGSLAIASVVGRGTMVEIALPSSPGQASAETAVTA